MTATTAIETQSETVGLLEERYELGARLGAGAMGEVYAAHDTFLGIEVAVKMMYAKDVSSPDRVARFMYEASVGSRMMSPHITKVLGQAVTAMGIPCIVYELLEGETLAARIARGALSIEETAEIVKQTARALARVHGVGVVHRDVKPDNIFLTSDLEGRLLVKLLDFGIAERMEPEARAELIGTPAYMPPEVLFGDTPLDPRADLYALGVVAFECLTGGTPFKGSVHEIFAALRKGERPSLRQALPSASRELDAWTDRALHADPFWRFASAKEMLAGLECALAPKRAAKTSYRRAA